MNVKLYIYTYTFPKKKQIFSYVILTHTAAGLSSKLVAVQCTVAIDIDLTRNAREETSVLNSTRFNMFEHVWTTNVWICVPGCKYESSGVCNQQSMNWFYLWSLLNEFAPAPEACRGCQFLQQKLKRRHQAVHILWCNDEPHQKLERSQGHFPRWLLRWIPGNATCPRAHAHWYYQTWTATASSSQDFVQNPSTMFS